MSGRVLPYNLPPHQRQCRWQITSTIGNAAPQTSRPNPRHNAPAPWSANTPMQQLFALCMPLQITWKAAVRAFAFLCLHAILCALTRQRLTGTFRANDDDDDDDYS